MPRQPLSRSRGRLILLLVLVIFLGFWVRSGLKVGSWGNQALTSSASLSVKTTPVGQAVLLDDEELGVTPLLRHGLAEGWHTLRLGEVEERIWLTNGALTSVHKIFPDQTEYKKQSWGSVLTYQKLPFLGKENNLVILVSPAGADLSLDGQQFFAGESDQKTFSAHLKARNYLVKVKKRGFITQEVPVEVKKDFLGLLEVRLVPNLFFRQERLQEVLAIHPETTPEKSGGHRIIASTHWRKGFSFPSQKLLSLSNWQTLAFSKLFFDPKKWDLASKDDVAAYLSLLEAEAKVQLGYLGLPFCFLILPQGQIYEGFGIDDFDFSSFAGLGLSPGDCLVAFLLPSGGKEMVSPEARNAASYLASFLSWEVPPLQAKLLTKISEVQLEPGEERDFSLEFQNTSSVVWAKKGQRRVLLRAVGDEQGRISSFYQSDWLTAEDVALFQSEQVLPTQVAQFNFKIKAPFYPGQFEQKLALVSGLSGREVLGSTVTLKISVAKEGALTVRIEKTPTGFLNVRSGPSLSASLVGAVYTGEQYLVLEKKDGWYKILLRDGSEGFIYAQYVKEV